MYDLAIIGGGPAGAAAGVYAARKRLKTILIAETIGGQSTDSLDVQNWIGTPHISGMQMAKQLESHLREYAGDVLELKLGERATGITKNQGSFSVQTTATNYMAQAVLITTGGIRKKLSAKNAEKFEHRGLTYCASCDGPLFAGQDVAVVGGGNAGFETAAQLLAYCKSVTLIHRHPDFVRADKATVDAVLSHPNMHTITSAEPTEVLGDKFVTALAVKDLTTDTMRTLPVTGVFVEIGMLPGTEFARGLVEMDEMGKIKVDPKTQRSSQMGIWAAGDCSDGLYHQNNIAAGDAIKALEDLYYVLKADGLHTT